MKVKKDRNKFIALVIANIVIVPLIATVIVAFLYFTRDYKSIVFDAVRIELAMFIVISICYYLSFFILLALDRTMLIDATNYFNHSVKHVFFSSVAIAIIITFLRYASQA